MNVSPRHRRIPWPRVVFAVLAALLTVLGVGLRFYRVSDSLWLDELHTSWTIGSELDQISCRARIGSTSSLYFYLPWAAAQLLGPSELSLRLPSLLAGAALIPLTCCAVLHWTTNRWAAVLSTFLVAVDPQFVWMSQEARVYALVQLIGLVQILLFWILLTRTTRFAHAGWIAATVILFYLHYTTLLIVPAQLVAYGILYAFRPSALTYRPFQLARDIALVVLCCLPAVAHLCEIAARRENWELFVERQGVQAVLTMFSFPLYVLLPACVFGAYLLARNILKRHSNPPQLNWRMFVLAFCWFLVPVVCAWLATYSKQLYLFFPRYLIISALAPIVTTGLLYAGCTATAGRVTLAVAVAVTALAISGPVGQLSQHGTLLHHETEDWRAAVAWLNREDGHQWVPVFVRSGLIEADALTHDTSAELREFCLLPITSLYQTKGPERPLIPLPTTHAARLTPKQLILIKNFGGACFVVRGEEQALDTIVRGVIRALPHSHCQVLEQHSWAGVCAARLSVSPASGSLLVDPA